MRRSRSTNSTRRASRWVRDAVLKLTLNLNLTGSRRWRRGIASTPSTRPCERLHVRELWRFRDNVRSTQVRFGKWALLENIQETLDAALEPILMQQTFKQGGQDMMKLGR